MQTVRHPNIVLFLGGGQIQDDCPFVVAEFVERGILRVLLDDASQVLSICVNEYQILSRCCTRNISRPFAFVAVSSGSAYVE